MSDLVPPPHFSVLEGEEETSLSLSVSLHASRRAYPSPFLTIGNQFAKGDQPSRDSSLYFILLQVIDENTSSVRFVVFPSGHV